MMTMGQMVVILICESFFPSSIIIVIVICRLRFAKRTSILVRSFDLLFLRNPKFYFYSVKLSDRHKTLKHFIFEFVLKICYTYRNDFSSLTFQNIYVYMGNASTKINIDELVAFSFDLLDRKINVAIDKINISYD